MKLPIKKSVESVRGMSGFVYIVDANGDPWFEGTGAGTEGTAADFIVTACNVHAELVSALKLADAALAESAPIALSSLSGSRRHARARLAVSDALKLVTPESVDGDLHEVSPEVLARLRDELRVPVEETRPVLQHRVQELENALRKIMEAHRFNISTMSVTEVHSCAFDALQTPASEVTPMVQHIPGNFTTHRQAWREALVLACENKTNRLYWQHEIEAYDRAFARLLDCPEPVWDVAPTPAVTPTKTTDLSKRLRAYANNPGYSHNDYADTMLAAADEIERYCYGMMAWKRSAEMQVRSVVDAAINNPVCDSKVVSKIVYEIMSRTDLQIPEEITEELCGAILGLVSRVLSQQKKD